MDTGVPGAAESCDDGAAVMVGGRGRGFEEWDADVVGIGGVVVIEGGREECAGECSAFRRRFREENLLRRILSKRRRIAFMPV